MENRTEFNLGKNIQNWKSDLNRKNNLTKSNIMELENHLLDLIDDLKSKGLNEEESFLIARKRIGKVDDISLEFDKVNTKVSFINTAIPYLKGALIYIAFMSLSKVFLNVTLVLSQYLNIDNSTFSLVSVVLLAFVTIAFLSLIYFSFKKVSSFFSNVYGLVTLIIVSLILLRLSVQIPLPGIDISKLGKPIYTISYFHTMEMNFAIYKVVMGFILLVTSLIFFWRHKKNNKVKYTK